MSRSGHASARHLVGRNHEQHLLREALHAAASGRPRAVVVLGEAGAGKTRLVRDVVTGEARELKTRVLWGTCVQFGASSLPFAPMITALRDVLPEVDAASHRVRLLSMIDSAVNDLARRGPTVLVVDDLQWADVSSLDVLAYLIAGFRDQLLAVVATCREESRPAGHPLYGWLADMRRMPSFSEIALPRLDVDRTAELLAQIHGGVPELELAAAVHARSDGNPYLTELLAAEIEPGGHAVPDTVPGLLREALVANWHRLDPVARDVMRILAVGGRPLGVPVLAAVAERHGTAPDLIAPALAAAELEGVLSPADDGRHWFRHPLLADVLYAETPQDEARVLHAAFAEVLASIPSSAAADRATHYERSGNDDEAFACSLAAASAAAAVHASAEQATHLIRACWLWPRVSTDRGGSTADRTALLWETARVACRVSRYDEAIHLLEQARSLVDPGSDPLLSSRLLSEWCEMTWDRSGPSVSMVEERYDALRLTEDFPDSVERAIAFDGLASAEMWDGDLESAREHAREALAIARRSGSDEVIASTLITWAALQDPSDEVLSNVEEALRLARGIGDVDFIVTGTIWLINALEDQLRLAEAAEAGRLAFEEALLLGEQHWCYFMVAMAAQSLLMLGRFEESRHLLREALAVRCVGIPGAMTRFVAAQHALRTGACEAARNHLDRALEVIEPGFGGLLDDLVATVAELHLADGDPRAALEWVEERAVVDGRPDQRVGGVALLWAARSLADLAASARDAHDAAAERSAVGELTQWETRFPISAVTEGFVDPADRVTDALAAAEFARCRGDADEAECWERAVRLCSEAGLRWNESCALVRLIEARVRQRAPRAVLAPLVRRLHRHAVDMGAGPLREQSEQLARVSRVSLAEPHVIPEQPGAPGKHPHESLTDREREVLGHLVAGRTNGEIARDLVISDKTVSVHVSNILRKTGTSSRAEVASWAVRLT